MKRFLKVFFMVFAIMLFFSNDEAYAYINPSSGSYIFQVVVGGILSVFYFFKKIIVFLFKKTKSVFCKGNKDNE